MSKIKVSDYIAKRLKEIYNVKNVFMVSGGGAMHLNDSFGRYIPYTCFHNEQACALAAEGYARLNQQLAVVNVTTGPGGLNCLNGVFGQWTDSVPVLYISGQVKFTTTLASCPDIPLRQLGDQEADIISVVKPLTKYAKMVTDPKEIKYHLDRAVYEATTGRKGPVWLDIPMNVQGALIDEDEDEDENEAEPFFENAAPKPLTVPDTARQCRTCSLHRFNNSSESVDYMKILEKLKNAKRPLIVAGHGIRLSGQKTTFLKLLEKLKIPVVTTFNGFDLVETEHPCFAGRIGTIGQRSGNFALQNADVVLFLGTRNNIRQVSYNWENFAKNAFKIIVDIDKAELQKPTVKPDMPVNADLQDFLPVLLDSVQDLAGEFENRCNEQPLQDWREYCRNLKEKYSFENTPEYAHKDGKISAYAVIRRITELLPDNATCVLANATAIVASVQTAYIKKNQRFISNSGDASMGFDLPASIGACIANNKQSTVCIAGDGSLMMNIQELQTVKHNNLPVKLFIINNDGYISIKQTQNNFFEGRNTGAGTNSGVSMPDFVQVGRAFGIESFRITKPDEIDSAITKMLESKTAAICEIMVNPDYIFLPKLSSRKLDDGTMISPSLEDMYPFLPREEFESNMIKD